MNDHPENKKRSPQSVCIISFTIGDSGIPPLANLIYITNQIFSDIYLITTRKPYDFFSKNTPVLAFGIDHRSSKEPLNRMINFYVSQMKIAMKMIMIRKKVKRWLFFVGGDTQLMPMLLAKISGKHIDLLFAGSTTLTLLSSNDKFSKIASKISTLNKKLCDNIIVYTPNLISEYGLQEYSTKIKFGHEHIINFELFRPMKSFHNRENIVGYLGRLSTEKGIKSFIDSIPLFLDEFEDTKVCIIGDGELRQEVESVLLQEDFSNRVRMMGWIPHDDLPFYLSELKLLVVPSSTEGLPNAILESMACGVPVLATSVGSIPDIISDGVNGFLMHDNSPSTIAQNVRSALTNPNLSKIAQNGRTMVEEKFRSPVIIECWRNIIM